MARLTEGKLACDFPDEWDITKYDDWAFYRRQFQNSCNKNLAVDFLCFDSDAGILWMIELKDYRRFRRTKTIPLPEEIAIKVRDTLAGLFAAKVERGHADHPFAERSLTARKISVVLHLEQPATHSRLFPRAFDPADVLQKLKQLIKPIDAHPRVIDLSQMALVPWDAESLP